MNRTAVGDFLRWVMLAGLLGSTSAGMAQQAAAPAGSPPESSLSDSVRELRKQIQELQTAVAEIRSEAQQYRAETAELRRQLESARGSSPPQRPLAAESAPHAEAASSAPASG
jgi:chromosome segregation ATPase